jgi:hypothetical protein
MNVKLLQGQSGPGCGGAGFFMPRQIIKCSDRQGAKWIEEGMAVEASPNAETDGEFFEEVSEPEPPPRRRQPERPDARKPETPEDKEPAASCAGTTTLGNPCKKAPVPGSEFCAKHQA